MLVHKISCCMRIFCDCSDCWKIYISECSVATQLWYGGISSNHFITNFPQNVAVKNSENRSVFGEYMDERFRLTFRATLYYPRRSWIIRATHVIASRGLSAIAGLSCMYVLHFEVNGRTSRSLSEHVKVVYVVIMVIHINNIFSTIGTFRPTSVATTPRTVCSSRPRPSR